MTSPPFTVVIPVHNEATFLPEALARLDEELAGMKFDLVLAENGSTDGTGDTADSLVGRYPWLRVIRLPQADYGAALRAGFEAAEAAWVIAFDIDYFSRRFFDEVIDNQDRADIILASKRDPRTDDRRSPVRRLGTKVFNVILRNLFGSDVTDTHGMKAVRRPVLDTIMPEVVNTQDLFDTELVLRAERAGYRITEVPAAVEELRPARSSYLQRVPRTLLGLWRLRRLLRPAERQSDSAAPRRLLRNTKSPSAANFGMTMNPVATNWAAMNSNLVSSPSHLPASHTTPTVTSQAMTLTPKKWAVSRALAPAVSSENVQRRLRRYDTSVPTIQAAVTAHSSRMLNTSRNTTERDNVKTVLNVPMRLSRNICPIASRWTSVLR